MDIYFYIILVIATVFGVAFTISVKGIYYATPNTDNELMAYAAAQSHRWKWLSDVHKYSASTRKVSMKEWTVILLSVFQKILRDKKTDWPYVTMTGTAVSVSAILIYLIAAGYFNPAVGLIVSILYIISFWPWQVSLQGGHANIANLFSLLSVYSIQTAFNGMLPQLILVAAGGAFLGLCLFSSPSSHKYFIAVFAALFFTQYRGFFASDDIGGIINALPANNLFFFNIIIAAFFLFACIFILAAYKTAIKKIYYRKTPHFINKVMSGRDRFAPEHYIEHAGKKIKIIIRWSFWVLFSLLLLFNLLPISLLLVFLTGFALIVLLFFIPNLKESVKEYFACMLEHKKKTHFRDYVDYFAKRGIVVQRNTRGAGISWVPKLLWKFIPFHTAIFIAAFIFAQYKTINTGNVMDSIMLILVVFTAVSPIIWAEITRAPQASRLYSPGLVTILLLPAFALSGISWTVFSALLFFVIILVTFFWNLRIFLDDVYPARMTVKNFMLILHKLGIKEVYTYKTNFNMPFIYAVPGVGKSEYLPERELTPPIKVHYIQKMDEILNGWIAIPGTSGKSLTAAGFKELERDYADDPILNRLIETKQIETIAEAKFKTFGTSTIWINEDDITSYRALHLKDICPHDLYRGYAWLIHSSKLKNIV